MKPINRNVDIVLAALVTTGVLAFCAYYWSFAHDFALMFSETPTMPWYARVLFLSVPWWYLLAAAATIGLVLVLVRRRRHGWRWLAVSAIVATLGMPLIVRSGASAIPVSSVDPSSVVVVARR